MSRGTKTRRLVAAWVCGAMLATSASGTWLTPQNVPVERIIKNVQDRLTKDPNDQAALLTLARAHSMAFYLEKDEIAAYERENEQFDPVGSSRAEEGPGAPGVPPKKTERAIGHLRESIVAFNRLLELQPRNVDAYLGLAYVLEMGREMASDVDATPRLMNKKHFSAERLERMDGALVEGLKNGRDFEFWAQSIAGDGRWFNSQDDRNLRVHVLWNHRNDDDATVKAKVSELLAINWTVQISECYFLAFCQALPDDTRRSELPMLGTSSLRAFEAATGYIRVASADGEQPVEQARLKIARATIKALSEIEPSYAVTPIVMHLTEPCALNRLTDSSVNVPFDLDGSGRKQRWPWLKADTAILVWNPTGDGKITSGRQLFGSVSWWLMFDNGYDALDALDDNRDGALRGDELAGLGVWQDRDQDGVSDTGEVRSLAQVGIVSISTRSDRQEDGCPAASKGVAFGDGRVLPTYDWIVTPVIER